MAGNGTAGFSGDGGLAANASLNEPLDVVVDATGNLYIADNGRVRKVSPTGIITTAAGGGPTVPGDGGPATSAAACPSGLALDGAGNLYFTDPCFLRVRKVSSGGIISTVAGNGVAGFSGDGGPATNASLGGILAGIAGIAVDAAGNLYIADIGNQRVRRVSPGGIITTVAGTGVRDFTGEGGASRCCLTS